MEKKAKDFEGHSVMCEAREGPKQGGPVAQTQSCDVRGQEKQVAKALRHRVRTKNPFGFREFQRV